MAIRWMRYHRSCSTGLLIGCLSDSTIADSNSVAVNLEMDLNLDLNLDIEIEVDFEIATHTFGFRI